MLLRRKVRRLELLGVCVLCVVGVCLCGSVRVVGVGEGVCVCVRVRVCRRGRRDRARHAGVKSGRGWRHWNRLSTNRVSGGHGRRWDYGRLWAWLWRRGILAQDPVVSFAYGNPSPRLRN